jgi:hypothetical protein
VVLSANLDSPAKLVRYEPPHHHGDEYRGLMRSVLTRPSLNELDHSRIREGDIMVTLNGVHTMAYIGDQIWIEADPVDKKVIKARVPEYRIVWFKVPSKIMRWSQMK